MHGGLTSYGWCAVSLFIAGQNVLIVSGDNTAELPVPGRPTYSEKGRERACCACSRCGWGCLDIFLSTIDFLFIWRLIGD